jgi:transcriptional regulator with XRE-family HTH domain
VKEERRRDFARRLSEAIQQRGWNQSELARRAGESRDNISNYVNAKALPLPHRLHKIAQALGMVATDLIPARGPAAADDPVFDAKQVPGGLVLLRINQTVKWDQFLRIAEILKEGHPTGASI